MVIHSEHDWRCPVEQGQRLFVALKLRGIDTEFLLFPGEGHELSRSGLPLHRVARFEHILRWWAKYLPTAANPAEAVGTSDDAADDAADGRSDDAADAAAGGDAADAAPTAEDHAADVVVEPDSQPYPPRLATEPPGP